MNALPSPRGGLTLAGSLAVAAGALLWCAVEGWALLRARAAEQLGLGD